MTGPRWRPTACRSSWPAPPRARRAVSRAVGGRHGGGCRAGHRPDAGRETADIAPPRFSIEILRNESGVSLIGLVPAAGPRQAVDEIAKATGDAPGRPAGTADHPRPRHGPTRWLRGGGAGRSAARQDLGRAERVDQGHGRQPGRQAPRRSGAARRSPEGSAGARHLGAAAGHHAVHPALRDRRGGRGSMPVRPTPRRRATASWRGRAAG